ncbi:MAG: protein NrnU [Betaproteobacteria bacterium]|nr:protein NrnU [Betaproteobacteria bacterium]NBY05486.1 protein NrnU [Betaproteobacteria bacterium]
MTWMILGLVLFVGSHALQALVPAWRQRQIQRMGDRPFKAVVSLVALAGFVGICWGYDLARSMPMVLWVPPTGMRHVAALLMLVAAWLMVAAFVPGNHIKARLRHPMVLSVKVWALAHLLANGNLEDVILFGSFLAWAVLSFRAARQRDRLDDPRPSATSAQATWVAVAGGLAVYGVILFKAHAWLVGVSPLGY